MSDKISIQGLGMTQFGKFLDKNIKVLTGEALDPKGGGTIGGGEASMTIHILEKE
jgi:hypothetical protein